jgi:acetamidase/formamidase
VVGDVHAMQGDGEIAGHTTDVAAEVTLSVHLIKGLRIDGPLLLPRPEDLPPLSKMYSAEELARAGELASQLGFDLRDDVAPIEAVGSGPNINEAVANGLERMAALANMGLDETKNRVTLTGSIEIGRLPGVVHVTMLMPLARLEKLDLAGLTRQQYGIDTS